MAACEQLTRMRIIMRSRTRILLALTVATAGLPVLLADAPPSETSPLKWKKIVIDKVFRSEGVSVADVNKDGKLDIMVGDFWYEAPDWKMHPIRKLNKFNDTVKEKGYYGDGLKSYSDCMVSWAEDVNGDGWPDQIVIGMPGLPAYWYENPKGQPGEWKEHMIWKTACNETPQFVDLFGSGKRVIVMGWQPTGKENDTQGQMSWFTPGKDPTQLWEMHPISEASAPGKEVPGTRRFSHGLGVGDVNGDGRLDVITTGGWWEQPAEGIKAPGPWKFHAANLGEAASDMFAYDMDGDGKADVISTSAHKFGMWWHQQRPGSNGSPSFVKHDLFPQLVSETHAVQFVDLDGDGLKDLVTGKRYWSHGLSEPGSNKPAFLYWLKAKKSSDGVTTFTPYPIDDDSGIGTQFEVIDINGDGKLDIVTSSKKGVYVHLQAAK
jgi:hypothetical protein